MKIDSTKHFILLILALSITPFILFLGKNFLQTEFFTAKYYFLVVVYCLFFTSIAICAAFLSKKILIIILFYAYFNFLQFYYLDFQQFLMIYKGGSTGYYVVGFIILVSLIGTFFSRSSIYRNFIFLLLFLNVTFTVINLTPFIGKSLQTFFNPTNTLNKSLNKKSLISKKYPNIFYIVPDSLASPKILKSYADISFEDSIKSFEEKGFTVPKHSYSSYNTTHLSLAALFKMDYPVTEKSLIYKDTRNFYPRIRENKPALLQYLKKNNYEFIIVPPMWGGCPSDIGYKCIVPKSNSYLKNLAQDYAIHAFLTKSLYGKIFNKYGSNPEIMNDSGKTAINQMKINPELWSEGGVFTMIHMLMPHTPYRDKNCSITDRYSAPSKEGYRSSVYCAFNRIHELSDFIIKNYPNATIVVQADHGIYSDKKVIIELADLSKSLIDSRFGIFTAVRGCNSNQAAKLNQVNIVNYIVECLVNGTQTKQLENKSFFAFYENSPEFGKIIPVSQ